MQREKVKERNCHADNVSTKSSLVFSTMKTVSYITVSETCLPIVSYISINLQGNDLKPVSPAYQFTLCRTFMVS